ncbi:hypothetical protein A2U01_0035973 [Trifolium medium]|uniref:Uncharacterized protein n=1 Tax=Trifolium medium TaxID=97028 RepID=A0A392PRX2_9FABA|nr:hypothetical protein [Trifolium medium]
MPPTSSPRFALTDHRNRLNLTAATSLNEVTVDYYGCRSDHQNHFKLVVNLNCGGVDVVVVVRNETAAVIRVDSDGWS